MTRAFTAPESCCSKRSRLHLATMSGWSPLRGNETRARLKVAAQRLFAQRGIDGVSVRDIVAAGGQRNNGSLNYYFRTKEALILELIVEGGRLIDESRNAYLDRLESD